MGVTTNGRGFYYGEAEGNPSRVISKNYGVYITGKAVYNAPVRDSETIVIPGRNGALYRDKGRYENIEVTYHCGMYDNTQTDFATSMRDFRNAMMVRTNTYYYLYDDYNTDEFRMAVYEGGLDVDVIADSTAGEFDVVFNCKPQRFLKSGDTTYSPTSGTVFTNQTQYESQPLISFQTTGNGTITITQTGSPTETITISGAPSGVTIYIDCELGEMFRYNGNEIVPLNNYVSFGTNIPVFYVGNNTFTYSNSLTNVTVKPRWWRL